MALLPDCPGVQDSSQFFPAVFTGLGPSPFIKYICHAVLGSVRFSLVVHPYSCNPWFLYSETKGNGFPFSLQVESNVLHEIIEMWLFFESSKICCTESAKFSSTNSCDNQTFRCKFFLGCSLFSCCSGTKVYKIPIEYSGSFTFWFFLLGSSSFRCCMETKCSIIIMVCVVCVCLYVCLCTLCKHL